MTINNPKESADSVNQYFGNVGRKLAEKVQDSYSPTLPPRPSALAQSQSFVLSSTYPDEIIQTMNKLKSDCAFGLDDISNYLIKRYKNTLAKPLACICNQAVYLGLLYF